jgi:hypothetical protein
MPPPAMHGFRQISGLRGPTTRPCAPARDTESRRNSLRGKLFRQFRPRESSAGRFNKRGGRIRIRRILESTPCDVKSCRRAPASQAISEPGRVIGSLPGRHWRRLRGGRNLRRDRASLAALTVTACCCRARRSRAETTPAFRHRSKFEASSRRQEYDKRGAGV